MGIWAFEAGKDIFRTSHSPKTDRNEWEVDIYGLLKENYKRH